MINQAMIYYFSGTGNARNVAHWIAEVATEKQIPVSMFDLAKIDRKNIPPPPQNAMLGFCGPTHGFNFPPVVMYFIFRFPKANGNKVFLVNTRAGMKLSKLFLRDLAVLPYGLLRLCYGSKDIKSLACVPSTCRRTGFRCIRACANRLFNPYTNGANASPKNLPEISLVIKRTCMLFMILSRT